MNWLLVIAIGVASGEIERREVPFHSEEACIAAGHLAIEIATVAVMPAAFICRPVPGRAA